MTATRRKTFPFNTRQFFKRKLKKDFQCFPSRLDKKNVSGQTAEFGDDVHLTPHSFRFSVATQYEFDKLSASVKMPSGTNDNAYINVSHQIKMSKLIA